MMISSLNPNVPSEIPFIIDGDAYQLHWESGSALSTANIADLPPLDYTIYLYNTVKFHLGQQFRLFDEDASTVHIHELYHDVHQKVAMSKMWFVQFLLILSFGTAFLSPSKKSSEPPGSSFFVRAMSLIPDTLTLWEDPVMAVETFALISLYLYSIDMKESAYLYVSN